MNTASSVNARLMIVSVGRENVPPCNRATIRVWNKFMSIIVPALFVDKPITRRIIDMGGRPHLVAGIVVVGPYRICASVDQFCGADRIIKSYHKLVLFDIVLQNSSINFLPCKVLFFHFLTLAYGIVGRPKSSSGDSVYVKVYDFIFLNISFLPSSDVISPDLIFFNSAISSGVSSNPSSLSEAVTSSFFRTFLFH